MALAGENYRVTNYHVNHLFHAGLVRKVPVTRVQLLPPDVPATPNMLHGSAPDIFQATPAGLKLLYDLDLITRRQATRKFTEYGLKSGAQVGHELMVRDMRVWLQQQLRRWPEHELMEWRDDTSAHVSPAEPDAWFTYRISEKLRFTRFIEADRGTERGESRWREKVDDYAKILTNEELLTRSVESMTARVVVITPTTTRRDFLTAQVGRMIAETPLVSTHFYFASWPELEIASLTDPVWRNAGKTEAVPLVPSELWVPPLLQ